LTTDDPSVTSVGTVKGIPPPSLLTFHLPEQLLRAIGAVAVSHTWLDYSLRLTIKTLARVTVSQVLDATEYQGSSMLRERIRKHGRKVLGESTALVQLQALMRDCERASIRRNELMHGVWCSLNGGEPGVLDGVTMKPLPSEADLLALADQLKGLGDSLNHARRKGFIAKAMKAIP
jgi:hypothetical protein